MTQALRIGLLLGGGRQAQKEAEVLFLGSYKALLQLSDGKIQYQYNFDMINTRKMRRDIRVQTCRKSVMTDHQ